MFVFLRDLDEYVPPQNDFLYYERIITEWFLVGFSTVLNTKYSFKIGCIENPL